MLAQIFLWISLGNVLGNALGAVVWTHDYAKAVLDTCAVAGPLGLSALICFLVTRPRTGTAAPCDCPRSRE
jgi:predicted MFS family arabinose efflux permease